MSGPCDRCGRDSSQARSGGGLWLPPDGQPQTKKVRTKSGAVIERNVALCADCRKDEDDGRSPWRSA